MKYSLIAFLVAASLLLSACAGPGAGTVTPGPTGAAPSQPSADCPDGPASPGPGDPDRDDPRLVRRQRRRSSRLSRQANNVKLSFIKSGDAGAALNKAILSKDAPHGGRVLRGG